MTAASKEEIIQMFEAGVRGGYNYMIMVCDNHDYSDFPVYAESEDQVREKLETYRNKNSTRVMEVYDLTQDMDKQMNMPRAWMV